MESLPVGREPSGAEPGVMTGEETTSFFVLPIRLERESAAALEDTGVGGVSGKLSNDKTRQV